MKHRKALLAVVVVVAVAVVGWLIYRANVPPREEVIKIGAILPLTGNLAFLGQPEKEALEVAIKEIRNNERIRIQLFVEDSKGQAKDAISSAQKLLNIDKVNVGIVSTSALSNAVAPIFQHSRVPLITICSDETIARRYDNVVNIYVNLDSEQETMAKFLLSEGISKISTIRVNAQITERGVKLLQDKSGGVLQIVNDITYELGTANYRDLVSKVRDDASQAIYLMGYGIEFPTLVRTLREMGVKKRVFGNYTFLSDGARREGTQLYKGIYFTAFTVTPNDILLTPFGKEFARVREGSLSPFMDYLFVYEAIRIWYRTTKSGVPLDRFPEYVRGRVFPTLLGPMEIDNTGNAKVPMAIATYAEDGSVRIVWRMNQ